MREGQLVLLECEELGRGTAEPHCPVTRVAWLHSVCSKGAKMFHHLFTLNREMYSSMQDYFSGVQ